MPSTVIVSEETIVSKNRHNPLVLALMVLSWLGAGRENISGEETAEEQSLLTSSASRREAGTHKPGTEF